MADHDLDSLINLPEGLRRQFADVSRRLWRVETAAAACALAASLLGSWLFVFISDRIWDTPVWLRTGIFLCGLAGATAAGLSWARHWIWHPRDLRALATLVQKRYRRLGDRLLGIVELAREQKHLPDFSPALYHAAIEQVAAEARNFDFLQSVNVREARRFGGLAGGLLAALAALCLVLPQAGWNSFLRWMAPAGDTARYTLVSLDDFPAQLIVPHGEAFAVSGSVHYLSFWKPSRVLARIGVRTRTESAVQSSKIQLQIPPQLEKGVLEVRVGDAVARVQVLPSHRPSLQAFSATIHLPDYLGYPDEAQAVQSGSLRVLEGSFLRFRGTVSRPLAFADMRGSPTNLTPLKIQGQSFSSDENIPSSLGEVTFNWGDQLGLTNAAPWRLSLQTQPDAPPAPALPDLPRAVLLLATDVLPIRAAAQDDFGVRSLGLKWEVVSDGQSAGGVTSEAKYEMSSRREQKAEKVFQWSPSLYGIPPDSTVELRGFATDFYPGRARARTGVYTVRVLSPESHAEVLRQELEGLMAQIEDVSRLQEKIVSDTRQVQEAGTNMPDSLQAGHLSQSQEDQLQNARQLQELARQGENAVREAMKNPQIPEDTVNQWAKTMQEWEKLSQRKMPDAARSMQQAAQNAQSSPAPSSPSESSPASPSDQQASSPPQPNSPSGQQPSPSSPSQPQPSPAPQDKKYNDEPFYQPPRPQANVALALQRAQEILDALRKMEQSANKNLDQLQALTLAQRLRKVGQNEIGLDGELVTNFADTLGLSPRELPEKFKLVNLSFARQQAEEREESAALQREISRFYERTQKTNYGQVSQDMQDSHAVDELDRMGSLIQSNITALTSLDLTNWAGRFQKWSEELSPKSGGGGGGQSGESMDLGPLLTALLRLRGRELTLRDQTSLLENAKPNLPDYAERAAPLAAGQVGLSDILAQVRHGSPIPELDPLFGQTAASMQQARKLLAQPRTDGATQGAEAKAVDTLSDMINLINEAAQTSQSQSSSSSSSATSAEQMGFLTQLMSQPGMDPAGMTGGGNFSGGATDRTGHTLSGDVSGQGAEARRVSRATGSIESYPAEFRDALENYFHAVENPRK